MSDKLKKWLVEDVGMEVSNLEKDFANGYAFGDLLNRFDLLNHFDKFEQKRTPDAMVNNYTRLQTSLRKIGVSLDSRTANSLMREEPGVALRTLISIKQAVEERAYGYRPARKDSGGRAGQSNGANKTGLMTSSSDTTRTEPVPGERFFSETMSRLHGTKNEMMETMHLRKFTEKQYKYEAKADEKAMAEHALAEQQATAFRSTLLKYMGTARSVKVKKLERDEKVHAALLKRKDEVEKEELRVEIALSEKARRKRLEELSHASLDVHRGIDAFEINMKRLIKTDDDSDRALAPATTHSPMEHMMRLRGMAPATSRLLEDSSSYVQSVQAQRHDDIATKKEREARRRKMNMEQLQEASLAEVKVQEEAFIAFLNHQAIEEQQLAQRMWLQREEEEHLRQMRLEREAEYAAKRNEEWEEALRNGVSHHQSMREQYQAEEAEKMATWRAEMEAQEAERLAQHSAFCRDIAWQVVMVAERMVEHRETQGGLVALKDYRKWASMFIQGDPALGDPVVIVDEEAAREAYLQDPAVKTQLLDYLECVGDFAPSAAEEDGAVDFSDPQTQGITEPIGFNDPLSQALADMVDQGRDKVLPEELPDTSYPLRLAVVGAPLSGKTAAAFNLSKRFNLRVISPEEVMSEAVKAAEEYNTQTAELAAAAAAAAAPVETKGDGEDTVAAPEPSLPPPPRKAGLGLQILAAKERDEPVADETLVALMVLAMEETKDWKPAPEPEAKGAKAVKPAKGAPVEPDPPQGFVLDGFPCTMSQAKMMEQMLTGLDLEEEQSRCDAASLVAPPPKASLPIVKRTLTSGIDLVFVLGFSDEAMVRAEKAVDRATGRRLDPLTGRVYHETNDPPPTTDAALVARLVEPASTKTPADFGREFMTYREEARELDSWLKRFHALRRPVDASGSLTDVLASISDCASSVLRASKLASTSQTLESVVAKAQEDAAQAKVLSEQSDQRTEEVARQLLAAKGMEMYTQASIADPKNPPSAAAEILKFMAGQKCAEQLRLCKAAAVEGATFAEQAASAATQAAEALQKSRNASVDEVLQAEQDVAAAAAAVAAALQNTVEAAGRTEEALKATQAALKHIQDVQNPPVAAEPGSEEAPTAEADKQPECGKGVSPVKAASPSPIPKPLCSSLLESWRDIETQYTESLASSFARLFQEDSHVEKHFKEQNASFQAMLSKPDKRPAIVTEFQEAFNDVPDEKRTLKEVKAGMLMRAEDLREMLWEVTDRKMQESEAHRISLKTDSFVSDRTTVLSHHLLKLLQVEVDRCFASVEFSVDYAYTKYGVADQCKRRWALKKPDVIKLIASEAQQQLLRNLMPPPIVSLVEDKSSQLQKALMMALAAAEDIVTSLTAPPEENEAAPAGTSSTSAKNELAEATSSSLPEGAAEDSMDSAPAADEAPEAETGPAADAAEGEGPSAAGADGEDGPGEDGEVSTGEAPPEEPSLDEVTLAAVSSHVLAVGARESSILQKRTLLIAQHALACIGKLESAAAAADRALSSLIKERYESECNAAWAVDRTVKAAAMEEGHIDEALSFMVDDTLQVHAPPPQLEAEVSNMRVQSDEQTRDEGHMIGQLLSFASSKRIVSTPIGQNRRVRSQPTALLSVDQLDTLVKKLSLSCPEGLLKVEAAAQLLFDSIQEESFPDMWKGCSTEALRCMLTKYDHMQSGYVDWRELVCHLIAAAFPVIVAAECSDMADQVTILSEVDSDKDGMVTEEQWESVELWFQYRDFRPGSESQTEEAPYDEKDPEVQIQAERTAALKKVLWNMFCSSSLNAESPAAVIVAAAEDGVPRMDYQAVLLYLCADGDVYQGIKKAGAVATQSISANVEVSPRELKLLSYPLGMPGAERTGKVQYDRAAFSELLNNIFISKGGDAEADPSVTVEQLIYSSHGEKLVSSLLQKYKWKDAFTESRV